MTETKIIAIDDDPTGSQTVHSCLLLTRWDRDTLVEALEDDSPLFFVLSNTRAMVAGKAAAVTREICRNLKLALDQVKERGRIINPIIVIKLRVQPMKYMMVKLTMIESGMAKIRIPVILTLLRKK